MTASMFIPYEAKTSLIHVSGYAQQNISGSLYNTSLERELPFNSTTQLLLLMEKLLDELNFPQRAVNERSFGQPAAAQTQPPAQSQSPAQTGAAAGKCLATFRLNVIVRQNASWQGTLVWVEQNVEAHFRSALELIKLMDSALTA